MIRIDNQTACEIDERWDTIVIGAGVAGAVASYLLARHGVRTLLVDAKPFPRPKVCGGCLNARAVAALRTIGLGKSLDSCQPSPVISLEVRCTGRRIQIPLPTGLSVSRSALDQALVEAAKSAGAEFRQQTRCLVLPQTERGWPPVRLSSAGTSASTACARMVLACDGLGHPALQDILEVASVIKPTSRIGLGSVGEYNGDGWIPAGRICIAVSTEGYVGLARAEQNLLSIAAVVDPATVAEARTPATVVRRILKTAGMDTTVIDEDWQFRGTSPITQHSPCVATQRIFLLGDAAGYVEPFTGEGMAAAIEGAITAVPLAEQAVQRWDDLLAERWQAEYTASIRSRQFACRGLAWLLRHPKALRCCMEGIAAQPLIGTAIAKRIGSVRPTLGKYHR